MTDPIGIMIALVGAFVLHRRLTNRTSSAYPSPEEWPRVSIIVPARNEASRLPTLLASLKNLDYPDFETIIVNDESTDDTARIAAEGGATVIQGKHKPADFGGKHWACQQGADAASGAILVFTDADVALLPGTLKRSVAFLKHARCDVISALPFHTGDSLWERVLGPFHVMLIAVTRPFGTPRDRSLFAIGQFLMFRVETYQAIGGHASVKGEMVEDIPLARRTLAAGFRYGVFPGTELFRVRMYDTFGEFFSGWRRNFRAGLGYGSWRAPLEVVLYAFAMTGGGFWLTEIGGAAVTLITATIFLEHQRTLGKFSPFGALIAPFSLVVFTVITAAAVYDRVFKRETKWKGRVLATPSS